MSIPLVPKHIRRRTAIVAASSAGMGLFDRRARAESRGITIAYQYGLQYLPIMVMQEQGLVQAAGGLSAEYRVVSGPSQVIDTLLSDTAEFGTVGPPGLILLWARTRNAGDFRAIGALSAQPFYLVTRNTKLTTVRDFTESDRIALPSIKSSNQAVLLQMAAADAFGIANFAQLDRLTVSMSHPDAMIALLSGRSEITAHFGNPPFQYQELDRGMKLVLNSYKVLGGRASSSLLVGSMRFAERNPQATQAVAKALEQATQWIEAHPSEAAALYIASSHSREDPAFVLKQLRDPDIGFSVVPERLWSYADFMFTTGVAKARARDWKELTFPTLHDRQGS